MISGAILEMDGTLGLAGWQWIFIIEAIPAVLLAFVVLRLMTERPAVATWLNAEERDWLEAELEAERAKSRAPATSAYCSRSPTCASWRCR